VMRAISAIGNEAIVTPPVMVVAIGLEAWYSSIRNAPIPRRK
jgi:hypothetical protein